MSRRAKERGDVPQVWPALLVGVISIPVGLRAFVAAERYAKRTGRLKRSG